MNKDKLFRIKDFITPISKSYHFKKSEIFPCFCMICLVSKSQGLFSCSLFPQGYSKGITKTVARAELLLFLEGLCKTKNVFYRVKKPFNKFWLPHPVTTLQIGSAHQRLPRRGEKGKTEGEYVKGHRIKRFVRVWGTNPFVVIAAPLLSRTLWVRERRGKPLQIEDLYVREEGHRKIKKKSFISIIVPKLFWYSIVKTSYTVIRPLLYFSRFTITITCIMLFLPVYPDLSNSKIRYSRNRIRKQIIPSIKFFFNPKVERALFQFSEFYNKKSILEKKKRNVLIPFLPLPTFHPLQIVVLQSKISFPLFTYKSPICNECGILTHVQILARTTFGGKRFCFTKLRFVKVRTCACEAFTHVQIFLPAPITNLGAKRTNPSGLAMRDFAPQNVSTEGEYSPLVRRGFPAPKG